MRPPDPCGDLDSLVWRVGPSAALAGRQPLLGQRLGDPAFAVAGSSALCLLDGEPRDALVAAWRRMGRGLGRARWRLRKVRRAVARSAPVPREDLVWALVVLAHDRRDLADGPGAAGDLTAAEVAAEELAVAAVTVASGDVA